MYKYFRILNREVAHRIMNANPNLSRIYVETPNIKFDEGLCLRWNTETDMLDASFDSDPLWHPISLDEEFLADLAPFAVNEREAAHAVA